LKSQLNRLGPGEGSNLFSIFLEKTSAKTKRENGEKENGE
jgi:hypothetical protein